MQSPPPPPPWALNSSRGEPQLLLPLSLLLLRRRPYWTITADLVEGQDSAEETMAGAGDRQSE